MKILLVGVLFILFGCADVAHDQEVTNRESTQHTVENEPIQTSDREITVEILSEEPIITTPTQIDRYEDDQWVVVYGTEEDDGSDAGVHTTLPEESGMTWDLEEHEVELERGEYRFRFHIVDENHENPEPYVIPFEVVE